MPEITLNQEQQQALKAFSGFLESEKSCFILTGGAGTGKTTLIRSFCELLENGKKEFLLLSPTGRASRVLQNSTGYSASTIHSAIYAYDKMEIVDESKNPEAKEGMRISFKLRDEDYGDIVLVVDEASMVGDRESENEFLQFGSGRLLKDLLDFARISPRGEGPAKAKVLFVGDPAQLPPVGETDSPALSKTHLKENHGLDAEVFELTKVMRQKQEGAILRNAHRVRESVISGRCLEFGLEKVNGEVEEITGLGALDLLEEDFRRSTGNSVLITHSNAKALRFNEAIRERLWKGGSSEIQAGDVLLVNRNDHKTGLCNGDIVRVLSVDSPTIPHNVYLRNIPDPVRLRFRYVRIAFPSAGPAKDAVEHRVLILENLLDSPERMLSALEQRALLVDFSSRNKDLKRNSKEFLLGLAQDPFFNALHVKYGYAMTCHKAQGGEWARVIVNFEPSHPSQNLDFFRWAYTAITRAKRTLLVIDAPSFSSIDGLLRRDETAEGGLGSNAIGVPAFPETVPGNQVSPENKDWLQISFAGQPEFLRLMYAQIKSICETNGLEILDVGHLQYCERYTLQKDDEQFSFDVFYKRSGDISCVRDLDKRKTDSSPFEKAMSSLRKLKKPRPALSMETLSPFLREFVEKLSKMVENEGIEIVSIEEKPYRLRVIFEEDGDERILDFVYNGKERWRQIQEVPVAGKVHGFKERIRSLLEGGVGRD